jgi:hypothetical protein
MHFNWFWPDVSDKVSARKAIKEGVAACAFIAAVDAGIAIYANVARQRIGGYGASVLVDGAVFALLALFLLKNSRIASVAALALMSLEIADKVMHHASTFNLVTMLLFLAILNSVRGAFAFHRPADPTKLIDTSATTPEPLG